MRFTECILTELINLSSRDNVIRKHMEILMISIRFQKSVGASLYPNKDSGFVYIFTGCKYGNRLKMTDFLKVQ